MGRFLVLAFAALLICGPADAAIFLFRKPPATVSQSGGAFVNMDAFIGVDGAAPGTGPESTGFALSFWAQGANNDSTNRETLRGAYMGVSDGGGHCEVSLGVSKGMCWTYDSNPNNFIFNFNNAAGSTASTDAVQFSGANTGASPTPGSPVHTIITFDTAVSGRWAIYQNEVDFRAGGQVTAAQFAVGSLPNLNNAQGWKWNATASGSATGQVAAGWYSDIVVAHKFIGCTAAGVPYADCTAANTIAPSMRAMFATPANLPMDIGFRCEKPFNGAIPSICLKGSGMQMAVNRGSATTPFIVGKSYGFSTGFGQAVFAAPYPFAQGISAIPAHQVTLKHVPQTITGAACLVATPCTATTLTTGSQPVAIGDTVILELAVGNLSTTPVVTFTCPTSFTKVMPAVDTNGDLQPVICYKKTDGTNSDTTGSYVITSGGTGWSSRYTGTTLVYANVASIDTAACQLNTATTTIKTPNSTTTSPNETLLSVFFEWKSDVTKQTGNAMPATGVVRQRMGPGSFNFIENVDEYGVASGVSTQRQITIASDTSHGCEISMVPN